jgi:hypothetical protein
MPDAKPPDILGLHARAQPENPPAGSGEIPKRTLREPFWRGHERRV